MKKCRIQTVLLRYTWLICLGVLTLYPELGRAQTTISLPSELSNDNKVRPWWNCSLSGSTVTCSGYAGFENDTIITLDSSSTVLTLNLQGGAGLNNVRINWGGTPANLTIIAPNLTIGENTRIAANFNVSGGMSLGNGVRLTGNVNAGSFSGTSSNLVLSGNYTITNQINIGGSNAQFSGTVNAGSISIGSNSTLTGDMTATGILTLGNGSTAHGNLSGGTININNNAVANGNLTSTGNVNLSQGSTVNGQIEADDSLNASQSGITVNGDISTENAVNIGPGMVVNGDIDGHQVNVSQQAQIHGNIDATGPIHLHNNTYVDGYLDAGGMVTIGQNSYVNGDIGGTDVDIHQDAMIEGNVEANGMVTNSGIIQGSVNATGDVWLTGGNCVSNSSGRITGGRGCVNGYVNAPNMDDIPPENVGGLICDQNINVGPCTGANGPVQFYKISHIDTALTCEATSVMIQACADPNCTTGISLSGNVTLNASGILGNPFTAQAQDSFDASDTITLSLPISNPGVYKLGLSVVPQAATGPVQCNTGGNCEITAVDVALRWQTIPPQQAGVTFEATIESIRTDNDTGACIAAVQGLEDIDLAIECVNPGQCTDSGSWLEAQNINISEINDYTPVPVAFDVYGRAALGVTYKDAGLIRLHASAVAGSTVFVGASNPFVVKPYDIGISVTHSQTGVNGDANTPGNDIFFARAGDNLTVTLVARNALGGITPNFGKESSPARLELRETVMPGSPIPGDITNFDDFSYVSDATFQREDVQYSEAGTAYFRAQIAGQDYLLQGNVSSQSSLIGRFVPWYFHLEAPSVLPACNEEDEDEIDIAPPFSYLGQPFKINATVTARNHYGEPTLNYPDVATPAVIMLQARDETAPVTVLSSRLTPTPQSLSWTQGVANLVGVDFTIDRLLDGTPDGPFDNVSLAAIVTEQAWSTQYVPMADEAEAACVANNSCNAKLIEDSLKFRFGRLALLDTYGPENDPAQVTLLAQYWDGTRFIQNNLDVCTDVDSTKLEITENIFGLVTEAVGTPDLHMSNGRSPFDSLFWTAPFQAGQIRFLYEAPAWLTFENPDNAEGNPTATAEFGQYGGHDRVIHWQRLQ